VEFFTNTQCESWIKSNGFVTDSKQSRETQRYEVFCDAGRKTALARMLVESLFDDDAYLIRITGHGVWPSSENMNLFDGYRKSLGEARGLNDVPGHLMTRSDRIAAECIIDLILYFSWDAEIIAAKWKLMLSHDDEIEVSTEKKELADLVAQHFAAAGYPHAVHNS
jgi:hypothetical protein